MVTVILPGYSIHNKDWAIEASEKINLSHEVRPILWEHWEDTDAKFDAKDKAGDVLDVMLHESGNIIAKSIGTLVASYMIEKSPDQIQKVIFCGIPLNDLTETDKEDIKNALRIFPKERIICFQNEEDPHGSLKEVENFLREFEVKIVSKNRDDHEYPYYSEFEAFLKN